MNNKKHQSGFTLIELMVAIVLGLLITAAAMQLFLGGTISYRMQENVAEVQDGGIFGMDYITQQIQLANYGNSDNLALNDRTKQGGIIFTSGTSADKDVNIKSLVAGKKIEDRYLSHSSGEAGWSGLSNTTTASDQLTIQFLAPVDMINCEGEKVFKGDRVIQRYFLRSYNSKASDDSNVASLGLACDANTPNAKTSVNNDPSSLNGFGTSESLGEIIIPRVDQLKIKVLARNGSNYKYYTIKEYREIAESNRATSIDPPEIQLVKISALIRSQAKTQTNAINPAKSFTMLGDSVALKTASAGNNNRYARAVYETTIFLRNGYRES